MKLKGKIYQNLYCEIYHYHHHHCFYVVVNTGDDVYHNLQGFRINEVVTELDLNEIKKDIKDSIKKYKKKHGVLFIFGYNNIIQCIIEEFGEYFTKKSIRKLKLDEIEKGN